ncbi:MAG: hypothetical protein ACRETA_14290 [Gammaproteobacteria bacterium]
MPSLPRVSGTEVVRALERLGFVWCVSVGVTLFFDEVPAVVWFPITVK